MIDKTMNMCKNYFTKTCSTISGANSCRYIGIAGCLCYKAREELYDPVYRKDFGYLVNKFRGKGTLPCIQIRWGEGLNPELGGIEAAKRIVLVRVTPGHQHPAVG